MKALDRLGRQFLFAMEPETAHKLSIAALRSGLPPLLFRPPASDKLKVSVCGLDFPNPLGMAAGYDKNAEVADALLALGFGFAEIGSVTPRPHRGNPRPRVFRLAEDGAVINRLGFNNEGHERVLERLLRRSGRPGVVGANIGAPRDSADRVADYEAGIRRFAPHVSYLTVNVSSPNTPGLRDLQGRQSLAELLSRVMATRNAATPSRPVFLKIAPDLAEGGLDDIAAEVEAHDVDGVIVSNTTLARHGLKNQHYAHEAGGLSGRPLFARSTIVLARMRRRLGPQRALIGVGGVDSAETALEKICAGADLVQLYTGMIYAGPSLPGSIVRNLERFAAREGLARLSEIRDSRLNHWADKPLD